MNKSITNFTAADEYLELSSVTTYQSGVVQSAAFRNLKKHTDDCLREHGLTTMQWFIIGTVYDAGDNGIRITELAKLVGTTLGFLTNSINLLESKGMLTRAGDNKDSRAKLVYVSASYRKTCKIIEKDLRAKLRLSIYSKVTPAELRVYVNVLYKFANLG